MADGDLIGKRASEWASYTLIDAKAATADGVWVHTESFREASIHVAGITTATVRINGSDRAAIPANTTHDTEFASLTADGHVTHTPLPKWIKARISAWTSGTISVFIMMRR